MRRKRLGRYLKSVQAAERLGCTLKTVQRNAAAGRIPGAAMFGCRWRFDQAALERWMQAGGERGGQAHG